MENEFYSLPKILTRSLMGALTSEERVAWTKGDSEVQVAIEWHALGRTALTNRATILEIRDLPQTKQRIQQKYVLSDEEVEEVFAPVGAY